MHLIIFDVDGTLVDSQHHIVAAQGRAFAAHGLVPPHRERALSVVGLSLYEAFAELAGPDAPIESLAEAYKDAWGAMRRQPDYAETLFPGAEAALLALAARSDVRLALATGKSRRGIAALCDARGWHGLFASVQTADDHPSKPHPAMIRAALAETGLTQAAMVGDTSYDMAMAVAAGVRALGVAWGYHPAAALHAAGAERVAADFDDLMRTLLEPGMFAAA